MAITQLSQTAAGTTDFTLLKDEITKNAKGINQITLSNYDNDSAPVVKVGSVFENDGTTFEVRTSDESPTGYSGISNSTTFFLYFDASATAFIYDSTAPTWDDAKQGYYHPTNTTDRAFFSMFKDSGGTLYQNKRLLNIQNNIEFSNDISMESFSERTSGNGVDANHKVNLKGGITPTGTLHGNSITENTIFDTLSPYIPNVNDIMMMSGGWGAAGVRSITISYAERTTSTRIVFYGLSSGNGSVETLDIDDGNATARSISLSW